MTKDDIILMADASGLSYYGMGKDRDKFVHYLAAFANLVAAQPEQEPCIGKDPRCPCQDGDACHYKDCGDTKALPVPVAQPPPEWELIKNIIAEYGLDAIAFVSEWKAAQRPWVGLTEFQFAEIYNKWNDTNGSTPWGLNQALEAKLRKLNK